MTASGPIPVESYSHVCIGVSEMATSLALYTGLLGMDVVFDVNLDGAGLDSVTGLTGGSGRDIGGVRMLFVDDPDQTPIEFIELPDGVGSTLQMWRPRG